VDIRRLKFFIVTAEERNIGRAAERLHITQPPLTRHIQSLEEELGVQLFKRTSAGVELTQAGSALLAHAHNITAHVELATEQIRRVAAGKEGRIDIGIFGSAMLDIIPRVLRGGGAEHVFASLPDGERGAAQRAERPANRSFATRPHHDRV
jgi:DNA-binding transcriptional LysR family regulator